MPGVGKILNTTHPAHKMRKILQKSVRLHLPLEEKEVYTNILLLFWLSAWLLHTIVAPGLLTK